MLDDLGRFCEELKLPAPADVVTEWPFEMALDDALVRAATSALTERCDVADIGAALGMTVIPAEAGTTSDALQLADQRMYASKIRGSRETVACTRHLLMQVLAEREFLDY